MTQVGMRQTGSARRAELEAARAYGSHLFPAEELHEKGWAPVLATIPRAAPYTSPSMRTAWIPPRCRRSWRPRRAAYSTARSPPSCGTSPRNHRVVGMDVVEVAPSYDSANGITAIMAGRLVMSVLGASWAAERGHARPGACIPGMRRTLRT